MVIVDRHLYLRCPKCAVKFDDYDNCNSLTCGHCGVWSSCICHTQSRYLRRRVSRLRFLCHLSPGLRKGCTRAYSAAPWGYDVRQDGFRGCSPRAILCFGGERNSRPRGRRERSPAGGSGRAGKSKQEPWFAPSLLKCNLLRPRTLCTGRPTRPRH